MARALQRWNSSNFGNAIVIFKYELTFTINFVARNDTIEGDSDLKNNRKFPFEIVPPSNFRLLCYQILRVEFKLVRLAPVCPRKQFQQDCLS